jgi:hypothetical protein
MSLIRRRTPRVKSTEQSDAGLQQIAEWERLMIDGNIQKFRDDGYDAETLARESANVKTLIANVAERLRADYLQSKKRP